MAPAFKIKIIKLKPHQEQDLLRTQTRANENNERQWPHRWSWILDEYKALKKQINAIEVKSEELQHKKKTDYRTVLPFPLQTNHIYGWLANKPDFQLEIFGSDVPTPKKIQEICRLG